MLSPELGLTAGVAIGLYGFALALRRPVAGGAVLGVGVGDRVPGRGFARHRAVAAAPALILPACGDRWRNRAYAATLAVASRSCCPAAAVAARAARARSGALHAWWPAEQLAQYIAVPAPAARPDPLYLRNLPWFAWPSLPLLLWTLWLRGRGFNGGLREARHPASRACCARHLRVASSLMPEPRLIQRMPLLVPLALIAALEVDSLKRGFSGALDWFGILTFGLLALVMWGLWIDAYVHGMSRDVARLFRDTRPASGRRSIWARCSPPSASPCCGSCSCGRRAARTAARC